MNGPFARNRLPDLRGKLGERHDVHRQQMGESFTATRPGAYLRVIEPGVIEAGDPVLVVSRPDHDVTTVIRLDEPG
jgi:MOSC domain-containing protein YiiM